jgi:serine protease Do
VIAVDGTPMEGPKDLQRMVAATPVGARLSLSILRDGKPEEVEVTVGPYRESPVERIER